MKIYDLKGRLAIVRKNFDGRITVAGDIHGDFKSFERIRNVFMQGRDQLLVFLGDYADRGSEGLEVVEGVKELLKKFEDRIIALKGNHEDYLGGVPRFSPCDLPREVERKRHVKWEDFFNDFKREFLEKLYLAVLIPSFALLIHGGISSKISGVKDLESPSSEVEEDVLWSDPYEGEGEYPNFRGAGVIFGRDISEKIARRIGIKYILRGHEPRKAIGGPCVEHSGRVFTISSTRVYGGRPFVMSFKPQEDLTVARLLKGVEYLS
jgi:serine/threonine-protein phosphatase 5